LLTVHTRQSLFQNHSPQGSGHGTSGARAREISVDHSASGLEGVHHSGGQAFYVQADGYLERIAKYVPPRCWRSQCVINATLDQAQKAGGAHALMAGMPVSTIATAVLVAGTILTSFFMWYLRKPGDAWLTNAFVSTLLYPIWAYALGSVAFAGHWDGNLAAILLASATVVSGLFTPRLPRKRRKERERELEDQRIRAAVAARPHMPAPPKAHPDPAPLAVAAVGGKK
jgi:hypothetical protein